VLDATDRWPDIRGPSESPKCQCTVGGRDDEVGCGVQAAASESEIWFIQEKNEAPSIQSLFGMGLKCSIGSRKTETLLK
jgi:hypothetical protein